MCVGFFREERPAVINQYNLFFMCAGFPVRKGRHFLWFVRHQEKRAGSVKGKGATRRDRLLAT